MERFTFSIPEFSFLPSPHMSHATTAIGFADCPTAQAAHCHASKPSTCDPYVLQFPQSLMTKSKLVGIRFRKETVEHNITKNIITFREMLPSAWCNTSPKRRIR